MDAAEIGDAMHDTDGSAPRERQRAARQLRDNAHDQPAEGLLSLLRAVTHSETVPEVTKRLADLIDPTCHAEKVMADTTMGRAVIATKCSVCHTVWLEPDRVRFCPTCGARRIFDDGIANATGGNE